MAGGSRACQCTCHLDCLTPVEYTSRVGGWKEGVRSAQGGLRTSRSCILVSPGATSPQSTSMKFLKPTTGQVWAER